MKPVSGIFFALITLIFACFMELNKQTIFGWVLLILAAIGFVYCYRRFGNNGWKKAGLWLAYLFSFVLIIAVSWPPVKPVKAGDHRNPQYTSVIMTGYGLVQGIYNRERTVEIFAGIPYAKPPVGSLRWHSPEDPDSWQDVRVCDTFAPMSMQVTDLPAYSSIARIVGYHDYKVFLDDNYRPPVSEDSLYLNIWKPAGEVADLPVLVYIHGGSLQTGQPWYEDYSGEGFAKDNVITVNMGYRLGVFGFLADETMLEEEGTTGNYGLLDQIKALEWVKDNIAAFGGDPENVTIVGESAGAVCVDALCTSPLAEGLFQRAILESSTISSPVPPHSFRLFDEAIASGNDLKQRYNASSIDDLRKIPAEQLVKEASTQHHVTIDGTVLTDLPYNLRKQGIHNETALLHGFNLEESGPFILFSHANLKNYETKVRAYFDEYADEVLALYHPETDEEADRYWAEIYGAVFFNYSHDCLNRLMKETEPVYEYRFSKANGRLSSWHSGEMIYAFGMIPNDSKLFDETDRHLSDVMHAYWTNFARTGDPNGEGLPLFETGTEQLMEFDTEIRVIDNPYRPLYYILDKMQRFR